MESDDRKHPLGRVNPLSTVPLRIAAQRIGSAAFRKVAKERGVQVYSMDAALAFLEARLPRSAALPVALPPVFCTFCTR